MNPNPPKSNAHNCPHPSPPASYRCHAGALRLHSSALHGSTEVGGGRGEHSEGGVRGEHDEGGGRHRAQRSPMGRLPYLAGGSCRCGM
jgi:hypothetical protein